MGTWCGERGRLGKELAYSNGLGEFDFGARFYWQAVPGFTSVDPMAEKYPWLSPYLYCANNPVNLTDPTGEAPSEYEAALMAGYVYYDEDQETYLNLLNHSHWEISNMGDEIALNQNGTFENGLQSVLFERTIDGKTEYAYVFAGTNSIEDALEDVVQLWGVAPQYSAAISNAKYLSDKLVDFELTFVGHSLGGGDSAAASMATGRNAITFNRSWVSPGTKLFNGLSKGSGKITNYITHTLDIFGNHQMEPLSRLQCINMLGIKITLTGGNNKNLYINKRILNPISQHSIKTIISSFK